ncbi:class II fructose-bisphosphate aldolase [Anaerococcus tetradius]|uniref:class II fructose-bisphosphate aldolase n=1 Tax=Anaerococcus tetradius TaxID=33036 RepID=UPI0023F554A9|nr:class II fructose-bisphosphate aldolase [Anaerococcus tetradius]
MLINSKEALLKAKSEKFAIISANFIDNNSARVFVKTAEDNNLPIILSYAQSHADILSIEEAASFGKYLAEKSKSPVILHLDHGQDIGTVLKAIELGFSSVMIDASSESFENNIRITKEVVEKAHKNGVTVEAELGHVGANDKSEADIITDSVYTEVDDVIEFVERTNVDSLAISIGTAHGLYKGIPNINFERLKDIDALVDIPLVLHGGSSSGDENLKKCAKNGISKINIYTDFINAAYKAIENGKFDNYIQMKEAADSAMRDVLIHYFDVFETKTI